MRTPAIQRAADAFTRWIGRIAAAAKGMGRTARSRGIEALQPEQQDRFERIIATFGEGYHAALNEPNAVALASTLDTVELSLRGFAYEGAAMALVTRQVLNPWHPPLLQTFLAGPGAPFTYLMHVGAGWTFGLVPGAQRMFNALDPLLRWLAIDGMGFRDFFFAGAAARAALVASPRRTGYQARAYDQGIGRCLWFVAAADVDQVPRAVSKFAAERQADLWSGIGLAAVYAGQPTAGELDRLRAAAGPFHPALAQGAAFAAKALASGRQLAARHDEACRCLCGTTPLEAAEVTDRARERLRFDAALPAYEQWRQRIQTALPLSTATLPLS